MADAQLRLTRLKDQWTHHYGQSLEIARAAQAKGYGLQPEAYVTPLPGTTTINVLTPGREVMPSDAADNSRGRFPPPGETPPGQQAPPGPAALSTLGKVLTVAALVTGLGGAGLGAWALLKPAAQAVAPAFSPDMWQLKIVPEK